MSIKITANEPVLPFVVDFKVPSARHTEAYFYSQFKNKTNVEIY